MSTKRPYARHDARNYETRRSSRWIDRRGERKGRLLCLEWIGRWKGRGFWKCQCDCGRQCIVEWVNTTRSCGCLQTEVRRKRDWSTLRLDGTWGHVHAKPVTLPDGRVFPSKMALARYIGIGQHAMDSRLATWPPERWLEPPHPRGLGEKKHRKAWIRSKRHKSLRPQPWSSAVYHEINRRRREKPA